ncbi:unnamed protein product, partial [Arabidopsis halleri]
MSCITNEANRFSKTVNSMLQLKTTIKDFLKCEVGDGKSASFWYDTWTDFGQLITFLGEAGPRHLRVSKDARVVDASRNGQWVLPAARSDNCQTFLVALTDVGALEHCNGCDTFLWRNCSGTYSPSFSSKETWEQIRARSALVPWAEVVWFKEHVPRFSLITWLAMLSRLPTRDRRSRWGLNIPTSCVLCSSGEETHHQLFFECSFAADISGYFASKFCNNPPSNLPAACAWNETRGSSPPSLLPPQLFASSLIAQCGIDFCLFRALAPRLFFKFTSVDEVISDGSENDKVPLDSATKQQDKSDTEMADISEDVPSHTNLEETNAGADQDVLPEEEHKTGDDEDVLPEDETKTGDDQDMLHQEESNVGDDQELFNAPSSPKRGADELEASPADEPTIAGQRNAGGAIGVDGNLSSTPSPTVIVDTVLKELETSVDVTAGTNVIEVTVFIK